MEPERGTSPSRLRGLAQVPDRRYTDEQQAAGQHLIDVHDGLRAELARLHDMIEQVAAGHRDPAAVRSFLNRMTIRQNGWTLGAFCASYCRVVAGHHTLEDRSIFPHLRARDAALAPVIDRVMDLFGDALLSHLSYEERELVEPLARLGFY